MIKPHHKSYGIYFKAIHNRARPKFYQRKRLNLEVLLNKLQTTTPSAKEFHFLFTHFKSVLGLGDGIQTSYPDMIQGYIRMVPGNPSYLTYDDSLPLSKADGHPWRMFYEERSLKKEVEISH